MQMLTQDQEKGLHLFKEVVEKNFAAVSEAQGRSIDECLVESWMQANWEFLFESTFPPRVFLEIYGEGGEFADEGSSRICWASGLPTHRIIVQTQASQDVLGKDLPIDTDGCFVFDHFVKKTDGWFIAEPNFDCALVYINMDQFLLDLNDCTFGVEKIP